MIASPEISVAEVSIDRDAVSAGVEE